MRLLKEAVHMTHQLYNHLFFLSKGVPVMLTINLWTDAGLWNDGTGSIVDFLHAPNQQPPDLPIAIIVKFSDYRGQSVNNDTSILGCVLMCPITEPPTHLMMSMRDNNYLYNFHR